MMMITTTPGPRIEHWNGVIFDGYGGCLRMALVQVSDPARPLVLVLDGCEWALDLPWAARIGRAAAASANAIETAERDKVIPRPKAYIRHARDIVDGEGAPMGRWTFEVAVIEEFPHCRVTWGDTVVLPPVSKRDEMLGHLESMVDLANMLWGEASGGGRRWSADELAGRPPWAPRPGTVQMNMAPSYRGRYHPWDQM
jgi:hypothetical protein